MTTKFSIGLPLASIWMTGAVLVLSLLCPTLLRAQDGTRPAGVELVRASPCDLDGDGFVSTIDVILFSLTFGEKVAEAKTPEHRQQIIKCDFNNDGRVDEMDLFRILSEWTPLAEPEHASATAALKDATETDSR